MPRVAIYPHAHAHAHCNMENSEKKLSAGLFPNREATGHCLSTLPPPWLEHRCQAQPFIIVTPDGHRSAPSGDNLTRQRMNASSIRSTLALVSHCTLQPRVPGELPDCTRPDPRLHQAQRAEKRGWSRGETRHIRSPAPSLRQELLPYRVRL